MFRAYFDNNASAPVLPEVREAMAPALEGKLGNASSIHQLGQAAKAAVENARQEVADLLGAAPTEIVFTSGGTESDNLAVRGVVEAWRSTHPGKMPHLVASRIEHHAVLNTCEQLQREGVEVTWLGVDTEGRVRAEDASAALRPETALVSVMLANNETGVLQPVVAIGQAMRAAKVAFHVDAIQAIGKLPVNVAAIDCQLLSLSGHKLHAPSGIGALYVRRGTRIHPLLFGGHHERERRAGSENIAGILGLGAAARLARLGQERDAAHLAGLRNRLERGILAQVPETQVIGGDAERVPNTSNLYFAGVEGEALVIALDLQGFCVSTGAACSSGALEPSHVLTAMGYSRPQARSCVRFSFGRQNTAAEVEDLLETLPAVVARLRTLSAGLRKPPKQLVRTA